MKMRVYKTFSATNAMLNLNVIAAKTGNDPVTASSQSTIVMPRIITVKSGTTATLTGYTTGQRITVNALANNGAMGTAYTLGASASATEFAISGTTLTPPTDQNETQYVVKYDRNVTEGVKIINTADKYPATIKLTLKALCVDPCEADTLRACYIVLPSFQPSPETTINLTTDGTLDFNGDLQVNYCSADKELYTIYYATADSE